jgi:selenocysteine lyase/cysteine desulfurase
MNRRRFLETTAAAGLAAFPASRGLAASTDEDPLGVRADFPVTAEQTYLNSSSVGPMSRAARDAVAAYADEKMLLRGGVSRGETKERARARFAELFGADEDEVAMLYSTSDGENVVVNAMDWRQGDNVVLDELHFVTSFVLYRELERRHGIELRIVKPKDGRVPTEDFAARVDERTRLLTVAWVSNRNGYRYDLPSLAELAHDNGAYLYADAVQALGTFPTNLHEEGVDFACGNGYKWLFADFGCAPMYIKKAHLEWMESDRIGHGSVGRSLPDLRFDLKKSAAKLEYATSAYASVAAMDAALGYLQAVGLARIEDHTASLTAALRSGAEKLGFDVFTPPNNVSSIVSFYHGLEPDALRKALAKEQVAVTLQEDGKLLRAGVAMFNNRADVDRLVSVLATLV